MTTPPDNIDLSGLPDALDAATERLLAERTARGHWVGELSDSALSTATAVFALSAAAARAHEPWIRRGLDWIAAHQNDDGGWGDTVRSASNLSTSVLCWSAFAASPQPAETYGRAVAAVETYVASRVGGLGPDELAAAVIARYGKDRTFSAPILMMAALAGRLGEGRRAWKHVAQLPFELAACPHAMLKALRLPVVSYALPALIAIGQARHHHRPTWNPIARILRRLVRRGTSRLLAEIQPESGGFLEAAPLTSFVLMALTSMRRDTPSASSAARHPVVAPKPTDCTPSPENTDSKPTDGNPWASVANRAVDFLKTTVRPSGAWPIDTDLATWVTTLSVNALSVGPATAGALDESARRAIRDWLLDQQYAVEHPYTRSAPGGWAWTDLSGGVPDADDTAGALRALRRLGPVDDRARRAAAAGCRWLTDIQNSDGGIPTFCRGWGRLPFDRSCQDLTAHAISAWSDWLADLPEPLGQRARAAVERAVAFLLRSQGPEGQWTPLWFGNEGTPGQVNNVYGTARVLTALTELARRGASPAAGLRRPIRRGAEYLLSSVNDDGGWGGGRGEAPSIEETALAVDALASLLTASTEKASAAADEALPEEEIRDAMRRGASWLIGRTRGGREFPAAPIGLYFAKLWYFERLYPIVFTVSALARASDALGE